MMPVSLKEDKASRWQGDQNPVQHLPFGLHGGILHFSTYVLVPRFAHMALFAAVAGHDLAHGPFLSACRSEEGSTTTSM